MCIVIMCSIYKNKQTNNKEQKNNIIEKEIQLRCILNDVK